MNTYDEIIRLLKDSRLDDEGSEESRVQMIEGLITKDGWEPVRSSILKILSDKELMNHWYDASAVLWGAVLEKRPLDANFTIAVLYRCLQLSPDTDENLVWSIASKLKRVEYLSKYDPLKDPEVIRQMQLLE